MKIKAMRVGQMRAVKLMLFDYIYRIYTYTYVRYEWTNNTRLATRYRPINYGSIRLIRCPRFPTAAKSRISEVVFAPDSQP